MKANDVPLIQDPGKPKTCAGCVWASNKWTFLGVRPYCRYYKLVRDDRCLDFRMKNAKRSNI